MLSSGFGFFRYYACGSTLGHSEVVRKNKSIPKSISLAAALEALRSKPPSPQPNNRQIRLTCIASVGGGNQAGLAQNIFSRRRRIAPAGRQSSRRRLSNFLRPCGFPLPAYARTHSNATEDKMSAYQLVMETKPLIRKNAPLTFNHGVEGSSLSSELTKNNQTLSSRFALLITAPKGYPAHDAHRRGQIDLDWIWTDAIVILTVVAGAVVIWTERPHATRTEDHDRRNARIRPFPGPSSIAAIITVCIGLNRH